MFCKNCGTEMSDEASFCNNCGTPAGQTGGAQITQEISKKEDNVVRAEVKPTYVLGYQILLMIKNILLTMLILFWAFFSEDFDFDEMMPYMVNIILWALGIVTAIFVIKLFFEKMQYAKTSYRFLKTKVEYTDSFLNQEEKQLKYEHIREVTTSQNIFERMFGIGKIRLYTNASSGYPNSKRHSQTGKNGIFIHCVKNVEEESRKIRELIDEVTD